MNHCVLLLIALLSVGAVSQAQTTPPSQPVPTAPKPAVPTANKAVAPAKKGPRPFLRAEQTRLYLGDATYRNIGANIPDLFVRFLHGEDAIAAATLTDAKAAGIRCVRCFGATWGPEEFDIFEKDRTRWLDAYDRMLTAADSAGIGVVPSLLFNIDMLPRYVRTTTGKDEQVVNYLTPGSASNDLAVAYVTAIVSRFKNDPRVLFWEIGNEYNLEADLSGQWKKRPANQIPSSDKIQAFLIQIAKLIKRLDTNHLVTSGNADMRPYAWHAREAMKAHRAAADPNDYPMDWTKDNFYQYSEMLRFFNPAPLDIVSVHQYAIPAEEMASWLYYVPGRALMTPWTRTATDEMEKPLFVGEFAESVYVDGKEQEGQWDLDFLRRVQFGTCQLAAVWSWEYDPTNPMQGPYSLSPQRTPKVVQAITTANEAIARSVAGLPPLVPRTPR